MTKDFAGTLEKDVRKTTGSSELPDRRQPQRQRARHASLRSIKQRVDLVPKHLSPLFDDLYAALGRARIPPEQLFKARVLCALYSVRSERLFCEQLGLLMVRLVRRHGGEGGACVDRLLIGKLLRHDHGFGLLDRVVNREIDAQAVAVLNPIILSLWDGPEAPIPGDHR